MGRRDSQLLMDDRAVEIAAAEGGGHLAEAGNRLIAGGMKQRLQCREAQRIRHPHGDRLRPVVFDDEEEVGGAEDGFQGFEQGRFILYIVKRVGHENAIEIAEAEIFFHKIIFLRLDANLVGGQLLSDSRMAVDGIDGAAGLEEAG